MKQTLRLVMYTYRKMRNALIITQQIASSPPSTHWWVCSQWYVSSLVHNGSARTIPGNIPHGATKCSAANNIALSRVVQMIAVWLARQIICLWKNCFLYNGGENDGWERKKIAARLPSTGIVIAPVARWGKACSRTLVAPNAPAVQTSVLLPAAKSATHQRAHDTTGAYSHFLSRLCSQAVPRKMPYYYKHIRGRIKHETMKITSSMTGMAMRRT